MDERRQFLKPGQVLSLGDTEYLIEDVEGRGGSSVVYRASYESGVSASGSHKGTVSLSSRRTDLSGSAGRDLLSGGRPRMDGAQPPEFLSGQ